MEVRDKNLKWIDSSVFRKEALKFQKNGYYCNAPANTPDWFTYWTEQLRRCIEGYEVGNQKITGHHYFYLNFTEIQLVEKIKNSKASKKISKQPDFWDGDYDYFWCLEIAKNGLFGEGSQASSFSTDEEETLYYSLDNKMKTLVEALGKAAKTNPEYIKAKVERDALTTDILEKRIGLRVKIHPDYLNGGHHMIVGKARRKGYSFKDGAICANLYNTVRNCQIIIGASEKKFLYPKGTMGMASDYLNFLNEHTGWAKSRDYVDKQDHKRASYKTTVNGVTIEKGYKSEIFALSFQDNPDAARGKDALLVLLEEAGAFPNLKDSFAAIAPALTAGSYITGQIVIFGTGGDMEGGTIDFADMFYHPEVYGLLPFINIWDDNAENSTCGFFHPTTWNMEGYYDEQGNSDEVGAREFEERKRQQILEASSSTSALQKRVQEFPFKPSEAFLTVSTNNFPIVELRRQLDRVIHEGLQLKKGTPSYFIRENGILKAKPDLKGELEPVLHYRPKIQNLASCPIIYEYPVPDAPKGLYKIGYDPYRQDQSEGVSLSSIIVYKSTHRGSYSNNTIVAEYVGRPSEADDVNRIAAQFAELYNTEVMHENEVTHVKNYFRRNKILNLLAVQPDAVISKNVKNSTVARVFGCHMNQQLKDAGEKYIKDWLLGIRDYDEDGNPRLNLESIYSIGILEELIQYNRKGNFDRVMALMQCMFQCQEEELNKEYKSEGQNQSLKELLSLFDNYTINKR